MSHLDVNTSLTMEVDGIGKGVVCPRVKAVVGDRDVATAW